MHDPLASFQSASGEVASVGEKENLEGGGGEEGGAGGDDDILREEPKIRRAPRRGAVSAEV